MTKLGNNNSITDVEGIQIGHYTNLEATSLGRMTAFRDLEGEKED